MDCFIVSFIAWPKWCMSHLHSGPGHAGSQTAPQCSPPPSRTESQLCSRTAPDAPVCGRSARSLHTSVASFPWDPEKRGPQHYRRMSVDSRYTFNR